MKKLKKYKFIFSLLPFLVVLLTNGVAAQEDSVTAKELVKLKYFNDNNRVQYLVLENFLKTGNKMEALKNKIFHLYLDTNNAENFIATVNTNRYGKAKSFLPPSLSGIWNASPQHKFIAVSASKEEEETTAELKITKAKIQIDTVSEEGTRSITVQVMKYENSEWLPANEVEITVGIQRHGGILSAGDEATYTTGSSGTVTVELAKDSLPGDAKGNLTIAAKVEDNDQYGNLLVEKRVPWGVAVQPDNSFFDQRTLWSTRFRTPFWLLFMAYSIVIGVWGTIIYLVLQIVKIKKMGTSTSP